MSFVLEMEEGPRDSRCGAGRGRRARVVCGTPEEGEARVLLGLEVCVLPDPVVPFLGVYLGDMLAYMVKMLE